MAPKRTPEQIAKERERAIRRLQDGLLPDCDLAPLICFDRRVLVVSASDSEALRGAKKLVLTLGHAYSDLKDIGWAMQVWSYGIPAGRMTSPDGYRGQHQAMGEYFIRVICGHLHELFLVLEGSGKVIRSDLCQRALKRVKNVVGLNAWETLTSGKKRVPELRRLRQFIDDARNWSAFHYDQGQIAEGFRDWAAKPPFEMDAFESLGDSMEQTRFYFADAGIQRFSENLRQKHGFTIESWRKATNLVNYGIRFVVEAFVEELCSEQGFPQPKPYPPARF